MNKKRILISSLIISIIAITGFAIYLSSNTNLIEEFPKTGAPSDAGWTNFDCTGACGSGSQCNNNVPYDPPVGRMWACYRNNSYVYKCVHVAINDGGNNCYLRAGDCASMPCGCDESACKTACLAKIGPGQSSTHTMLCSGCGQKFTCGCSKPQVTTPVPTTAPVTTPPATTRPPTTVPPTTKPPKTTIPVTTAIPSTTIPLTTIIPTTVIPETALISDELDRIVIGAGLFFLGLIIITFNYNIKLGNLLWKIYPLKSTKEKLSEFEDKF